MNKNFILILILFSITFVFGSSAGEVNRTDAVFALNQSEKVIDLMKENNFSVVYVKDLLFEANQVLKQIDYAMILQGKVNATPLEKMEATKALKLIDWKNLTYNKILDYSNRIEEYKSQSFNIYDELNVLKIELERSEKIGVNITEPQRLFESAKTAFYEDRFNESESFISDTKQSLINANSQASVLNSVTRNTKNFIQRYWIYLVLGLMAFMIIFYLIYKSNEIDVLNKKIKKLNSEQKVLVELMKKLQTERFKEHSLSKLSYEISMKKYKERLEMIKTEIPVLKARLNKLKK